MTTLKSPFIAEDMPKLYKKICKGEVDPIPIKYTPELSILILQLLSIDPTMRPSCK